MDLQWVHVILKEWSHMVPIEKISFRRSTFVVRVHGLPPVFLHEGTARQLGNLIGELDEASLSKKVVISERFLRFRVEVLVEQPLPAGFFMDLGEGEETWIQFKYECLADFCYRCGMLNHVTGKCHSRIFTSVKSNDGLVYGPWLKAEVNGGALLLNPPSTAERRSTGDKVRIFNGGHDIRSSDKVEPRGMGQGVVRMGSARGKGLLCEGGDLAVRNMLIEATPKGKGAAQTFNLNETLRQSLENQSTNIGAMG